MDRLQGKVAIVTGAASGMGAAEAYLFAAEGAKVLAADIQLEALERKVAEIKKAGFEATAVRLDVTDQASWQEAAALAVKRYGSVDILLNNAGIFSDHSIEETSLEEWNKIIAIDLNSVFLGMKACLPYMKACGGSIINVSSTSGLVGEVGCGYCAAKGAVRLLSKNAARDYAPYSIRVNSLHPGTINTPLIAGLREGPVARAELDALTPLPPHLGEPEDIAKAALFLACDDSRFMTGAELLVDGGYVSLR